MANVHTGMARLWPAGQRSFNGATMVQMRQILFPPFRLDPINERLMRDQEVIPLRPKSFAVLRYLAERPDELVRKEELIEAVCRGHTSLTHCSRGASRRSGKRWATTRPPRDSSRRPIVAATASSPRSRQTPKNPAPCGGSLTPPTPPTPEDSQRLCGCASHPRLVLWAVKQAYRNWSVCWNGR
jgi:hypothetical protein